MTLDPAIREQTYQYFLQEAPELLTALEQGLLSFREEHGINPVNNLMRITHTLKGASNSVGLNTIATVAHSLEDIFKALCNPNAVIDPETEALLFEGVDCLRIPLVAELTGRLVNHAEILDRAAAIFAQLQEKLGDCFDQTAHLPTSTELGFDITQSIFEAGVDQRLEQLTTALGSAQPQEIAAILHTQAEVFLGLAESLNLPGFGAIAQAAIAALGHSPERAVAIAEIALVDFRAGQAAVLAGDRSQGGYPSETLLQFAHLNSSAYLSEHPSPPIRQSVDDFIYEHVDESNHPLADQTPASMNSLLENIWGGVSQIEDDVNQSIEEIEAEASSTEESSMGTESAAITLMHPVPDELEATFYNSLPSQSAMSPVTSLPQREAVLLPSYVRVNVRHLDQLNYSIGELLTTQNRQALQIEQLQNTAQTLFARLQRHQQLLNQLRTGWNTEGDGQATPHLKAEKKRSKSPRSARLNLTKRDVKQQHRQAHLLQSVLDDMVQLTEVAEAIDLFTQQAQQTQGQQHRLLTHTRSALVEARMLALGEIFNRLPPVLQQLETLHAKPVTLDLQGVEVLVDKVIAEKLYDPLLHLVRNAFDHGIEPIAVRQQRGKPEQGKITISAANQGRHLIIKVQDDGGGLDFEQIRQRGLTQHLIAPEQVARLHQTQLIELLFEPGFSTAAQLNDLSGRGIGLDVVRTQLQALRGTITVQTEPLQGTTFVLQIPLNLTIAPLLVCEAGAKLYALLDDAVEQVILPQPDHIQERNRRRVLRWCREEHETMVPLYALAEVFADRSTDGASGGMSSATDVLPATAEASSKPVLLLRHQQALLGIEVDQLLGEQELVIRPLGELIEAPPYIHGASILADGRLALVMDGENLLQKILGTASTHRLLDPWHPSTSILSLSPPSTDWAPGQSVLPLRPDSSDLDRHEPKPHILIVDDSITTRQNLALIMQKTGYQVFQAQNGYEALQVLQRQPVIRLVICDLEMPIMNGFELLRQVQSNPALADLPILMLTSRRDEEYRLLASQLGAAAYMTKPYMEYKLLTLVSNLLEHATGHERHT